MIHRYIHNTHTHTHTHAYIKTRVGIGNRVYVQFRHLHSTRPGNGGGATVFSRPCDVGGNESDNTTTKESITVFCFCPLPHTNINMRTDGNQKRKAILA